MQIWLSQFLVSLFVKGYTLVTDNSAIRYVNKRNRLKDGVSLILLYNCYKVL